MGRLTEKQRAVLTDRACQSQEIETLRLALTEKRRDRIGDCEISGAYLCRAEKAEASLAAAQEQIAAKDRALKSAELALRPFYNAVFNDNGDITVDGPYDYEEAVAGYFAYRKVDAALTAPQAPAPAPDMEKAVEAPDYFGSLLDKARQAAAKASAKFPQPNYVTLKIAEEAGEVVRGAVHYAEGRMDWSEVEGEIVQLLAMLIRFVTEGDEINGIKPPALRAALPHLGGR